MTLRSARPFPAWRFHRCVDWSAVIGAVALSMVLPPASYAGDASENAALHYWPAFAICPLETSEISAATTDDQKLGFKVPVGPRLARHFQGRGADALACLHRGAALSNCEWGTNLRKYGPLATVVHGEMAHRLARIALLRARWRFEHSDWDGGIDDVIATMILGRHIGRDKLCQNVFFGCQLDGMATGTLAVYLPGMPREALEGLSLKLDGLPPRTSMHDVFLYHANAVDWAVEHFAQAEKEGKLVELLVSLSSKEDARKMLSLAKNAEGLTRMAEAGRPLVRQLAEATSLDPRAYDRLYQERFAPALEANPVAAMLGCWYDLARDEVATADCRVEFIRAAIDILRRGPSALAGHTDPYGDGPFEYRTFDGGFELTSKLVYFSPIRMDIGLRANHPPPDQNQR